MKQVLLLSIAFILLSQPDLVAQKVKYKKGKVYVNKEHRYNFNKIEDQNKTLDSYVLKNLNDTIVLSIVDTAFYLYKLPHEIGQRIGYEAYKCTAHKDNLVGVFPYSPVMGYPKQRVKDLSKVGFFSSGEFTEATFNQFIEKQYPDQISIELERLNLLNKERVINYNLSVELLDSLKERKPSTPVVTINIHKPGGFVIRESNTILAEINLITKGSNNHSYSVVNHNLVELAEINIFQNPQIISGLNQIKYNVKLLALGTDNSESNYKWFSKLLKNVGSQNPSTHSKMTEIAKYLVVNGFL